MATICLFISIQKAANENKTDLIYYILLNHDEVDNKYFKGNKNLKKITFPPSFKKL